MWNILGFFVKVFGWISERVGFKKGKEKQQNEELKATNKIKDKQLQESNNRDTGNIINRLRDSDF